MIDSQKTNPTKNISVSDDKAVWSLYLNKAAFYQTKS